MMAADRKRNESEQAYPANRVENTASVGGDLGNLVQVGSVCGGMHIYGASRQTLVPQQLPPAPAPFVGRENELTVLTGLLDRAAGTGGTVMISALAGAGGIGKTWLALHWAHHCLDRFPDGQLFVNLRGFSPDSEPMTPEAAVRGFLYSLGVQPERITGDLDKDSTLYRSLIAGKRMLVVLDNTATTDQVEPLLPGSPTCTVLITSRRALTALITRYGARHMPLSILGQDEAHVLLAERLGEARVAADPDATRELIRLCGRYPLALAIMASHAQARPHIPLAEFAAELREAGLDALVNDDPVASLPAVLSWSLRGLTTEQRTVFALLGTAPGSSISLAAATSLTGLPEPRTRKALRVLEESSLLDRQPHGRYSMHDLIRAYARDIAHQDLPEPVREAALRRTIDFYIHTAFTGDRLLHPNTQLIQLDPPAHGCLPHPLLDTTVALDWFDAEHPCLLAAQQTAAARGWRQAVWHLAWTLDTYHLRRGRLHDRVAAWRAALAATEHLPDPVVRTLVHRLLGQACADVGRHEEAIGHLRQALTLAEQHHDPAAQIYTHRAFAWAWRRRGDDRRALDHATRALALCRTLDNPVWEALALSQVGWHAAQLGEYEQAREHCQAALDLYRRHHAPTGEADTLDNLGYIDHHLSRHQQAVGHYRQGLALRRDIGDASGVANTLDELGHTHAALDQHDKARAAWQEALELYRTQQRIEDADRIQRQLDALGSR